MAGGLDITLIDQTGGRWPVHCELTPGARHPGITLAKSSVKGIEDAPFETDWIEDTDGTVLAGVRGLPNDLEFGFYVSDELAGTSVAGRLESDFRKAFTVRPDPWNPDARLPQVEVRSALSGVRRQPIHLKEAPARTADVDPYTREQPFDMRYLLRGATRLWDSGTDVSVVEGAGAAGSGFWTCSNPTDQPMRVTMVLTRGVWEVPDVSWQGPEGARVPAGVHADRSLVLPEITELDGGVRLTRERRKLVAQTFTGRNFLSRMGGRWLMYDVPPYTPPTLLPVSWTGAPAGGARAELHMPRLWSRPVGMEHHEPEPEPEVEP